MTKEDDLRAKYATTDMRTVVKECPEHNKTLLPGRRGRALCPEGHTLTQDDLLDVVVERGSP